MKEQGNFFYTIENFVRNEPFQSLGYFASTFQLAYGFYSFERSSGKTSPQHDPVIALLQLRLWFKAYKFPPSFPHIDVYYSQTLPPSDLMDRLKPSMKGTCGGPDVLPFFLMIFPWYQNECCIRFKAVTSWLLKIVLINFVKLVNVKNDTLCIRYKNLTCIIL